MASAQFKVAEVGGRQVELVGHRGERQTGLFPALAHAGAQFNLGADLSGSAAVAAGLAFHFSRS